MIFKLNHTTLKSKQTYWLAQSCDPDQPMKVPKTQRCKIDAENNILRDRLYYVKESGCHPLKTFLLKSCSEECKRIKYKRNEFVKQDTQYAQTMDVS